MTAKSMAIATMLIVGVSAATNTAQAQLSNPGYNYLNSRPTVSPYLNLLNSGNGLPNYQTLVRPEIDARDALVRQGASLQQLQQQFQNSSQNSRQYQPGGQSRTGHGTRFMNLSHYYSGLRH